MNQRLFIFIYVLFVTTPALGMRIEPTTAGNTKTIITKDGQKHAIDLQKLAECKTLERFSIFEENPAVIPLPGITSDEWLAMASCLEDQYAFDTPSSPESQKTLPEETRKKLKDKKRLRDVLMAANYLEHSSLMDTTMQIWGDERFEALEKDMLPSEMAHGITQKIINSTVLDESLPLWIAQNTHLKPQVIPANNTVWACCRSNDATKTAMGLRDGNITVFDAFKNQSVTWKAHDKGVTDLHFSPDANLLFSVAREGTIKIWNASNEFVLEKELVMNSPTSPFVVRLNPAGILLAAKNGEVLEIWDLQTNIKKTVDTQQSKPKCYTFNNNSTLLAVGTEQNNIHIVDVATTTCLKILPIATRPWYFIEFNHASSHLAVAGDDNNIYLINLNTSAVEAILPAHTDSIWGLQFSPCDRFLISCASDNKIKLWDLATYNCIKELKHKKGVNDVRLTTDLQLVTGSHDNTVKVWPFHKFFNKYQSCKRYFARELTIAQANLIRQALEAPAGEPLDARTGTNAETFKDFPSNIRSLLTSKLSILKPSKKKRKADDDDDDYIPE